MTILRLVGAVLVSVGRSTTTTTVSATTADPRDFEPTDSAGNVLLVTEPVPASYLDNVMFVPEDLLMEDYLVVPSDFAKQPLADGLLDLGMYLHDNDLYDYFEQAANQRPIHGGFKPKYYGAVPEA